MAPRADRLRQRRDQGPARVRLRRPPAVHRSGLLAYVYRASEGRHRPVELAAHELLQRLDMVAGIGQD